MSASTKKKLRKEQNAQVMTERQKKERAEVKKTKIVTAVFVVAIALIFCAFIGIIGTTVFGTHGLTDKITTAVIIDNHRVSSAMMNYFYIDAVQTHYSSLQEQYGQYASYFMGFDPTKPLEDQPYDDSGKTWGDYFMDIAVDDAKTVYAIYDHAKDNDFEITDELQEIIDSNMMQIQFNAAWSQVSTNTMLRSIYGNGANENSYEKYITLKVVAAQYYQQHQDSLSFDSAAISAYGDEHINDYSSFDFYSYYVDCKDYLTGGTEDAEGNVTYSDEENEAARAAAEADANALLSATNADELNQAIAALYADEETATEPEETVTEPVETEAGDAAEEATEPEETEETHEASLNNDVEFSTFNAQYKECADWLASSERTAGDITSIPDSTTAEDGTKTVKGYYVLMFISRDDKAEYLANVRHILIAPTGGTTENNVTTYSEEEWNAAKTKAESLLAQWEAGEANEDSFIALVAANTADTATAQTGGLYEDLHKDSQNLTDAFLNWALSADREANQAAVIKSTDGYHVMYYVGDDEMTYRDYLINQDLIANAMNEWQENILASCEVTRRNESRIKKDFVLSPSSAA